MSMLRKLKRKAPSFHNSLSKNKRRARSVYVEMILTQVTGVFDSPNATCYKSRKQQSRLMSSFFKMALRVAVCVTTLLIIAVAHIKKYSFCGAELFNLITSNARPVYEVHGSSIFSSHRNNRKSSGILLRPTKSAIDNLIDLFLMCDDTESCPGPTVNCCSFAKKFAITKAEFSTHNAKENFT